ncbi:MAG: T9SS type A sorting domain-containing protein [Bacteroidales bacterium]|nr:T9SS type A sorting domain-containing protein [Bacteroidales bacterium]
MTKIDIHNLIGQVIYSQDVVNTQNFNVNTDNWNPGMYFVVIHGVENTTRTLKVIKK